MGNELVSGSQPHRGGGAKSVAALSYTEMFYLHLPHYLAIGMPYHLFWDGDCRLTESFRRADEIKRKQKNQDLWLQGMYVYEAFCDASPLLRAFSKKPKPLPYPSEPYALTQKEMEERREKKEQLNYEKGKVKLAAWAAKSNAQIAARAGEG